MPTFANGRAPLDLFINFGSGRDELGEWAWLWPAGTLAKHLTLVRITKERTGRVLRLTDGYSCYRPIGTQIAYRDLLGNGAAVPGTSSHGGVFWGRQSMAGDYHNWAYCFNGDRAAWYQACRDAGFEPGVIEPRNGFPDEPWHVIDWDPWRAVDLASLGSTPFEVPVILKGDEMATIYLRRDSDGLVVAIPQGGKVHNFSGVEEYDRNRSTIAVINGQRDKDKQPLITLPPALTDIVTVSGERMNDIIHSQGAS